ncbi:hypothetical protein LIER_37883 [Lithospermum erythrorhizon]|uniref:Uncharacterized protein n=1 Tax=Lithospermum erythrorhizon TaxID=34254 RepID=A0AAV3PW39_LITER
MTGKQLPLFKRAKVITKTSKDTTSSSPSAPSPSASRPVDASIPSHRKRPLPPTKPLFGTNDHLPSATVEKEQIPLPSDSFIPLEGETASVDATPTATHLLLLEDIGRSYEELHNPLTIHGATMKHIIEVVNASYVLTSQMSRLREDCEGSHEREKNQLTKIQELEKENDRLVWLQTKAQEEKKEACLQTLAEILKNTVKGHMFWYY